MLTLDELRALKIDFVSVHEPYDTTTPMGRLLFTFVAAFAEFERESLRERTRSGVAAARRRGKQLGRPKKPIDLIAARDYRGRGWAWPRIARHLKVSRATLLRAVKVERQSQKRS
jgi:DNA invertase Pin-like site-specific DNA recombinase